MSRDLIRQRLFLVRDVSVITKKTSTTKTEKSRREFSRIYNFTVNNRKLTVCKIFFPNTSGIPESSLRIALEKINEIGVMDDKEKQNRVNIENHIDRYPKVESHYCRTSTNRLCLHSDLSLRKMYMMFTEQEMAKACNHIPSSYFQLIEKYSN
nr:unnamed protein product [Callosobruchus analis]CAI5859371.1 unnamed protein product [Callosobruchus analis]